MRRIIFLAVLSVAAVSAQVPDPPYDAPGAQEIAEMRAAMSYIFPYGGYMPPPVGWLCEPVMHNTSGVYWNTAVCRPDPSLVDEQQNTYDVWLGIFNYNASVTREDIRRNRRR